MDTANEHVPQVIRRLEFDDSIPTRCVDNTTSNGNYDMCTEELQGNENPIHCNVPDSLIPKIGMEFDSEDDAYSFYNKYAEKVGFSIRRHKGHKSKADIILDRVFSCSCHGKRVQDKRNDNVKKPRAETRFGCLAELRITGRYDRKYRVYKFVAEHSHGLVTPKKSHMLRSQRRIKDVDKAQLDMAESVGITPKESMDLLAVQAGGRENIGFIPEDYRNYLRTKRTMHMKLGDTGGVLEYLQHMQDEDAKFSYAIQVDCDDLITNIFWADARMKIDYSYFGDVVCFDTTYRKNKEGRPLALFVGVNHHKQSIIFGGALLYDETIQSFEWLFKTFAKVMSDKKPQTILTDESQAMAKALESSWPETYHRLCVWHMYQNAAKHLSSVFASHKSFVNDFSSCIYDHDEVSDFVEAWEKMLAKYNLVDNDWLKKLYRNKEKWALVYGRQTFCADMSTTQRSESINSRVKMYVDYKHDLLRFFQHFRRLVEDRRYEELKADFKASQSTPALDYPAEILKHAASTYTPAVFKIFHQELWKTWDWNVDVCNDDGIICEYKVSLHKKPDYQHFVTFETSNCKVSCSCKKFEFSGILCSHALKVFHLKNIHRIPEEYILKRWSKDAKAGGMIATRMSNAQEDPKMVTGKRFKELSIAFNHLSAKAAKCDETYDIAIEGYHKMLEAIEGKLKGLSVNSKMSSQANGNTRDETDVGNGETRAREIRAKGLKPKPKSSRAASSKRIKSALERAFTSKRPRMQKQANTKVVQQQEDGDLATIDGLDRFVSMATQQRDQLNSATFDGLDSFITMPLPTQASISYVQEPFSGANELDSGIDLNMEPIVD